MSEHYVSIRDRTRQGMESARRTADLQDEVAGIDSYYELDEIQLVQRYDKFHELEQQQLPGEQRELVDFICQELLTRIEYKISPSFRAQLEEEAYTLTFNRNTPHGRFTTPT
jgi:hypothetical protein